MKRASLRAALLLAALAALAGCPKTERQDAERPPVREAGPPGVDARTVLRNGCLSCHTEDMIEQQRLTKEKWTAEVNKMVDWGANVDPQETAPLVDFLAARYGVDAGVYLTSRTEPELVARDLEAQSDGRFANGDVEKGKAVFTDKCAGCHGNDARGHIGTNLVERPVLYRVQDLAETIRRGRGKMTPIKIDDHQIADCVAYLRTLKAP